ncbi:MAG: putative DNA-binding domain-containing protein [Oligoflexales bacterium]
MGQKTKYQEYEFSEFEHDFLSAMNDGALPHTMMKMLKPIKGLHVEECLQIYTQAKKVRLCDTLHENFSACAKVIGDHNFFSICEDYLKIYTPESYSLEDYGSEFPFFLAERSVSEDFPFLPDLADFEWKFKDVFHAKHEIYDAQSMLGTVADFSQVILYLQANVRLVRSDFRVKEIWDLRDKNETEIDWEPLISSSFLLLYRYDSRVFVKDLSQLEYDLMALVLSGHSIGKVMEEVCKLHEHPDLKCVEQTFQFLISKELIIKIEVL